MLHCSEYRNAASVQLYSVRTHAGQLDASTGAGTRLWLPLLLIDELSMTSSSLTAGLVCYNARRALYAAKNDTQCCICAWSACASSASQASPTSSLHHFLALSCERLRLFWQQHR